MLSSLKSLFNLKNKQDYLGKYKKPEILSKLEFYQENGKANWENLEFYIKYDYLYGITPIDIIPFAYTGNNGIHFGFLTDFGLITDLNDVPIVCLATSYDPPINIVAKNLKQFLSFLSYAEQSSLLADIYDNQIDFDNRKKEFLECQMEKEYVSKRMETIETLKHDFEIELESDIISKIKKYRTKRDSLINTKTVDGIGLIFKNNSEIIEFDYNKSIIKIRTFLENSNINSRFKFYRQSTFMYFINDLDDWEIKRLMIEHMRKDGLISESKIINKFY